MNLPDTIKAIQRAVGADADGVFGPETATLVWRALNDPDDETQHVPGQEDGGAIGSTFEGMDERSARNLITLDPKAHDRFAQFYRLANATAATYGCRYIIIGGNRTWEEQDALYQQGRTTPGARVTNARAGQSNHNFGIAADFGVFQGKAYLDTTNPQLAAKVHRACSMHAAACGMEWGGSWTTFADQPHYQVPTGKSLMQLRRLFKERGSVL